MNTRIALLALFAASGLAACQPSVVNLPPPVATPGPAGPQGATGNDGSTGATGVQGNDGMKGDKGRTGGDTTLIVVPPAASSPSN